MLNFKKKIFTVFSTIKPRLLIKWICDQIYFQIFLKFSEKLFLRVVINLLNSNNFDSLN